MIGLLLGAVSGAVQFLLLSKFTSSVTGGEFNAKAALFGVFQFFIPVAVLTVCAFLFRDGLVWAGIGMAAVLVAGALFRFVSHNCKSGGGK